jgi:3-oxoacyl-[acyl-carrier-protein] synthase II
MLNHFTRPHRVVITGVGCVTPIGIGREAFWRGLHNGDSGVRRIEGFDVSDSPVKIAAQVPNFDWEAQLSAKDRKHVPRTVPLALAAAREALADANYPTDELSLEERRKIGVVLGTGGGGLTFAEQHYEYWYKGPHTKASVYIIPAATHGTLSSELSMVFGLRGLSHVISTGCTSSTDAIAYAAQHIALGRQELMISGGVDAPLAPGILAIAQCHHALERRAGARLATIFSGSLGNSFGRRCVDLCARRIRTRTAARREDLCGNSWLRFNL